MDRPAGDSSPVYSNQTVPHPGLESLVRRHQRRPFGRPASAHSLRRFDRLDEVVSDHRGPLVLDAGCGSGDSTLLLARRYPEALVIGVDKSAHRLKKLGAGASPLCRENYALARMDLVDFWRLADQAGWRVTRHYILYPTPWPKQKHIKRRWQGHPVITHLPSLGGVLELRTNWLLYAQEFAATLQWLCGRPVEVRRFTPVSPLTPFETKYQASGHALYRCVVDLDFR